MQYINHQTHTLYSIEGKPAHWRDIPVTSDPPDPWAKPVVKDGKHVGWEPGNPPVPESITMRQLLIGLRRAKWITPAQADAWSADGTLPPTITAVIDAMPTEDERVDARITARKMSVALRDDPLLIAAAQAAMPEADEQEISDTLDQAFRDWSKL